MSRQVLNEQTFAPGSELTAWRSGERMMTIGGTIAKALLLLIVTVIFAALGWRAAANVLVQSGLWFFLGYLLLIALTFAAVANPRLAAGAGLLYAVLMGTWMGAISRLYEHYYDGVVGQAIFVTLAVFLACLVLYSLRAVRVTGRFVQVVLVATFGVAVLYLFAWIMSLFGFDFRFWSDPGNPWGHRDQPRDRRHRRVEPPRGLLLHRAGGQSWRPGLDGVVRRVRPAHDARLALHRGAAAADPGSGRPGVAAADPGSVSG